MRTQPVDDRAQAELGISGEQFIFMRVAMPLPLARAVGVVACALTLAAGCAHGGYPGAGLTAEERVERCTPNKAALFLVPFYVQYSTLRCQAVLGTPGQTPALAPDSPQGER